MPISTIKELYEALSSQGNDFEFGEQVSDTIRISGVTWGGSNEIDYRTAELVLSIQKDILNAYREITGRDIRMTSLATMPVLVVHAVLNLSMGKVRVSVSGELFQQFASNRMNLIRLAMALSPNAGTATASELSSVMKSQDEIDAIHEAAQAKRSNRALRVHLRSGTAECESSRLGAISKQDLTRDTTPEKKDSDPIALDDHYLILAHNYDQRRIFLGKQGLRGFWASTEMLTVEKREVLKDLSDRAIDAGGAVGADFHISANIRGSIITTAYVLNIQKARRKGAHRLEDVQRNEVVSEGRPTISQGSLLDL